MTNEVLHSSLAGARGEHGMTQTIGRPPSMADVAAVAGVSHQTVSRVLNEHPSVRDETRGRVEQAIAQLGYRRNSAARALVTRRTGTIGVLSVRSALFGPTSILIAVEGAARESGYHVLLTTIPRFDSEATRAAFEYFLDRDVEGIVIVAPQVVTASVALQVQSRIPIVVVSSAQTDSGRVRAVSVDHFGGARAVTRHLIETGRRSIVHVAGPQDWHDAIDRRLGWQAECEEAGLADLPKPLVGGWSAQRGYETGLHLVERGVPEAVFAANDQLALGVLRAFWEKGVRVPDDVAVAGFDDEDGAAHFIPPLTTVRQDFAALGHGAIVSLLDALGGSEPDRVAIPTTLVRRQSTGT